MDLRLTLTGALAGLALFWSNWGATAGPLSSRVVGSGPVRIMLVHDWLGDSRNWDLMVPFIDARRFTFALVDLPGYGGSRHVPVPQTTAAVADLILATATDLGWRDFTIVGHSMSGMIVLRAALGAPERVKSAVVITPVGPGGDPMDAATFENLSRAAREAPAMTDILNALTGRTLSSAWTERKVAIATSSATAEARIAYLRLLRSTNFSNEARNLPIPLLAISGSFDLPPFSAAAVRTKLQPVSVKPEYVDLPTGHYPMQEMPLEVLGLIEAFATRSTN